MTTADGMIKVAFEPESGKFVAEGHVPGRTAVAAGDTEAQAVERCLRCLCEPLPPTLTDDADKG